MIAMLNGQVESVDQAGAILDVHGIGFGVRMPQTDVSSLHAGQHVVLYTSMVVTQDAMT